MAVARPVHLTKLYTEYGRQRSSFARELADIFQSHSQLESWSTASVLDIGFGGGQISQTFASLGANVTGIEYDIGRVMQLASGDVTFRAIGGDGHHLPFEGRSFDFIILADVLEHVRDANRIMQEVARVSRSGALVFVGATNRASIANLLFDPHYNAPLIPLMSKRLATWYVTRLLKLSNSYGVEKYFFRGELLKCLRGAGFSCDTLPLYREKIVRNDFAAAPGRTLVKKILTLPGVRSSVLSIVDTGAFEYWIAPGFNFLCRRDRVEGRDGQGELVCSVCHGRLRRESQRLTCSSCGRQFENRQGIPLMHVKSGSSDQHESSVT